MANLYDKAGLVNIPVGYQDGFLYNIKPEDNTLGFRFNRDSAATRVNKEGLIEQVGYFGPELVQNGDFSQLGPELVVNGNFATDSDWTKGTGWSITGGKAVGVNASGILEQSISFTENKIYKISFSVLDLNSGSVAIQTNQSNIQTISSNGDYEIYYTSVANDNEIRFNGIDSSPFNGSIDNISCKEVGQDWDLVSLEFIGDNTFKNTGTNGRVYQSFATTVGSKYKVSATVNSGTWNIVASTNTNTSGTIQSTGNTTVSEFFEFTATGTVSYLVLYNIGVSGSVGSITNASVVEIQGDKPRIDYTDSLTSPSFLLEPQSTNLLPYSENFNEWNKNDVTIESGYLAPDGTNDAFKVNGGSTSSLTFSPGLSSTDTRTIWARTISGTGQVNLTSHNNNTNNLFTITEQWQRFEVNGTTSSSGQAFFYAVDFRGSSTLTEVVLWGAQAETLPYATSYIPTAGSTVTRAQETCNGAGNASTFNSAEGVLYAEIAALANDLTNRYITLSDGTSNNRLIIRYSNGNNNLLNAQFRVGGVLQANINKVLSDITISIKVAFKFKQNDFALWIDGVEVGTDTSGSVPSINTFNKLSFEDATGGVPLYGRVKGVYVFNEALTDDELQQLTGPEYNSFAALAAAYNYTVI